MVERIEAMNYFVWMKMIWKWIGFSTKYFIAIPKAIDEINKQ
jgi:hypothetical protein